MHFSYSAWCISFFLFEGGPTLSLAYFWYPVVLILFARTQSKWQKKRPQLSKQHLLQNILDTGSNDRAVLAAMFIILAGITLHQFSLAKNSRHGKNTNTHSLTHTYCLLERITIHISYTHIYMYYVSVKYFKDKISINSVVWAWSVYYMCIWIRACTCRYVCSIVFWVKMLCKGWWGTYQIGTINRS